MGKYKEYYYRLKPSHFAGLNEGNITSQLELKEYLQCKSFEWFLENVAFDWLHLLKATYPQENFD